MTTLPPAAGTVFALALAFTCASNPEAALKSGRFNKTVSEAVACNGHSLGDGKCNGAPGFSSVPPLTFRAGPEMTVNDDGADFRPVSTINPSRRPTPMDWGCAGDGVADDTACVQAAMTAMAGQTLYTGKHVYSVSAVNDNAGALVLSGDGEGHGYGFKSRSDAATITLTKPGSLITRLDVDSSAQKTGTAIVLNVPVRANEPIGARALWLHMKGGCNAVALNGLYPETRHIRADNYHGSGCEAFSIGRSTAGGNTFTPKLSDLHAYSCHHSSRLPDSCGTDSADAQIAIHDAAAGFMGPPLDLGFGSKHGLLIRPGAINGIGQTVTNFRAAAGYYGDASDEEACLVDTSDRLAAIVDFRMTVGWCASSLGSAGLKVDSAAGGTVDGVHLIGLKATNNWTNGVEILPGPTVNGAPSVKNVTIDDSSICGNSGAQSAAGPGTGRYSGIVLGDGVDAAHPLKVAIRNTTANTACDNSPTGHFGVNQAHSLVFGTNDEIILTGNDFSDPHAVSPVAGTPGANTASIVANNKGIDDDIKAVPSGLGVGLPINPVVYLTGGSPTTLAASWNMRPIDLVAESSTNLYGFCGNLSPTILLTQGQHIHARWITALGCWSSQMGSQIPARVTVAQLPAVASNAEPVFVTDSNTDVWGRCITATGSYNVTAQYSADQRCWAVSAK